MQEILPGLQEQSRIEGINAPLFVYLSAGAPAGAFSPENVRFSDARYSPALRTL